LTPVTLGFAVEGNPVARFEEFADPRGSAKPDALDATGLILDDQLELALATAAGTRSGDPDLPNYRDRPGIGRQVPDASHA